MMDDTFAKGQGQHATVKGVGDGANPFALELSTFPIKNEHGDVVRAIEIIQDVSEREHLMDELVRIQALALLGRYCAELTHEIKNPLNAIALQIHIISRMAEKLHGDIQEEVRDSVHILQEEVARLDNLSKQYLHLTRAPVLERKNCTLQQLLSEVLELTRPRMELSHLELKTELGQTPAEGFFDGDKIKQVFINIVNNALEVLPHGGALTVTVQKQPESVRILFTDTGSGIAPESRDKIFQPFFSTKTTGTGLGLTVAKNIIEAHGGSIWFLSGSQGTTFFVELPLMQHAGGPGNG
jgi:signal transduction histidine kinase